MTAAALPVWERGRFDAAKGTGSILFGRMYEDAAIERRAFAPGGRIFSIASAGCTAMALAPDHDVVAVDINPVQLAYAARRLVGGGSERGVAERLMATARTAAPLVGWTRALLHEFLALGDPDAQLAFWQRHLDTRRFRTAFDSLLSLSALRVVYASPLLACLPRRLGPAMRGRLRRGIGRHANRDNPYLRGLLLGEPPPDPPQVRPGAITLVGTDAAAYLEAAPAHSFDGFTISNILDGAPAAYRRRLIVAIRRAARPDAIAITRSFSEPASGAAADRAGEDRAMIWGQVEVQPVAALG